ncbi:hypothetical protein B0H11DRAFT_1913840 [Mycena galericulata]|nr:hypothetical protein B0H11DRAFT_1913840 [Mycena galericulata]
MFPKYHQTRPPSRPKLYPRPPCPLCARLRAPTTGTPQIGGFVSNSHCQYTSRLETCRTHCHGRRTLAPFVDEAGVAGFATRVIMEYPPRNGNEPTNVFALLLCSDCSSLFTSDLATGRYPFWYLRAYWLRFGNQDLRQTCSVLNIYLAVARVHGGLHSTFSVLSRSFGFTWSTNECFRILRIDLRRPPLCRTTSEYGSATGAVEAAGTKDDWSILHPVMICLRNLKSNRERGAEAARTGTWIVHVIEDTTSLCGGVPLSLLGANPGGFRARQHTADSESRGLVGARE